jgi:hypothetical protein
VAAKHKSKDRSSPHERPYNWAISAFHFQASRRRDEILEEAQALEAAGKIRNARKLLKQARDIARHLRALGADRKLQTPHPPE